jgi:hypothetical protein
MDQAPFNQEGGNGRAALQDAYVSSWHIPWATVQVGQQTVWFNRALISSVATSTFADNTIVQNMFASNLQSSRDIGINILSDEDQYKFNYAFGIWGGVGPNLARDGTSVSQRVLPPTGVPGNQPSGTTRTYNYDTRFMSGELMYTARLLYKIAGNPGYGQGDILNSRTLQSAIGFGYAYDPAQNYLSSTRSDIVDRSYRQAVAQAKNGRLLGGGIYDFQTYETDFITTKAGLSRQKGTTGTNGYGTRMPEPFRSTSQRSRKPLSRAPRWISARPGAGTSRSANTSSPGSSSSQSGMGCWIHPRNKKTI